MWWTTKNIKGLGWAADDMGCIWNGLGHLGLFVSAQFGILVGATT